ncbi:universal stress protein [Ignicoccus hospitalis]|nr:universal stress protein [Ignicoccus hospitalis]HIH90368.1 universal stress protein [Desulfurococcaceae archaeon]
MEADTMFKKILMAHDSSLCGWKAFEVALDLAKKYGAKLYVVHAVDTTAIPDIPHKDVLVKPLLERAEKLKGEVEEKLKEAGVEGEFIVVHDNPVNAIVKKAEDLDVDLVVMGARGAGPVGGYLLGSVSTRVLLTCNRSVLVVKGKAPAASKL